MSQPSPACHAPSALLPLSHCDPSHPKTPNFRLITQSSIQRGNQPIWSATLHTRALSQRCCSLHCRSPPSEQCRVFSHLFMWYRAGRVKTIVFKEMIIPLQCLARMTSWLTPRTSPTLWLYRPRYLPQQTQVPPRCKRAPALISLSGQPAMYPTLFRTRTRNTD
jgi:hypothetical protein